MRILVLTATLTALVGCGSGNSTAPDVSVQRRAISDCVFEANTGSNVALSTSWTRRSGTTVRAVESGDITAAEAAAANACADQKLAQMGFNSRPNERTTRKQRRALRDQLASNLSPLPDGYPMQPGDNELWVGLTPEQQARARLFIQDGSTIRSSLEAD